MATIPMTLDDATIAKVDALVKNGLYKSRSEALRAQITQGLARISLVEPKRIDYEKRTMILQKLLSLERPPNLLRTKKSVAEMVSEGRER